jgi:hypothetical protein
MFRTLSLFCLLASAADADTLRLTTGAPVPIAGIGQSLKLTAVEDQRCPPDVSCIWEGLVKLTITVSFDLPDSPPDQMAVLCNVCEGAARQATVAGLILTLDWLEPSTAKLAALGRRIEPAGYTAIVTAVPAH